MYTFSDACSLILEFITVLEFVLNFAQNVLELIFWVFSFSFTKKEIKEKKIISKASQTTQENLCPRQLLQ